jgi:hypothetical protein
MRSKARRLAQLEERVAPYQQRQKEERRRAKVVLAMLARYHAMMVGALVLYGEPKLNEKLEIAWERCLIRLPGLRWVVNDVDIYKAIRLLQPVLNELPGETEQQKLQHLLDTAPLWLLSFTGASITADILKLQCPELSDTPPAGRNALFELLRGPRLPRGTLQAGGPLRPIREETLPEDERKELHAEAAEWIGDAFSDSVKRGVLPDDDPKLTRWIRKNRRNRRRR